MTAFAGTNTCSCPSGPAPQLGRVIAGEASISLVPDQRVVSPGQEVVVRAFLNEAQRNLQSYQLHLTAGGGRSGALELVGVSIEQRDDFVFGDRSDVFQAVNIGRGQMLAGLDGGGVPTPAKAYLASFTYRVSKNAVGTFVIDVRHDESKGDQTYLVASFTDQIELKSSAPAVVTVHEHEGRPGRILPLQ